MHIQGGFGAGGFGGGGCTDCGGAQGLQRGQGQQPGGGNGVERRRNGAAGSEGLPRPGADLAAEATSDTKSKLVVQTAEGDRVSISLEAHSRLSASAHSGPDGSSYSVEQSSSFSAQVSVQGQLSDSEVEDIRSLLQKLAELSSQGSSSPTPTGASQSGAQQQPAQQQAVQQQAPSTQDLETIAAYQYQLQQTTRASAQLSVFG